MGNVILLVLIFISILLDRLEGKCTQQEARYDYPKFHFETVCEEVNREAASQLCRSRGGWLAEMDQTITDGMGHLTQATHFYTGLIKKEGDWIWETSGTVTSTSDVNWASGNPTGDGTKECAVLGQRLYFTEWDCDNKESLICQFNICSSSDTCSSAGERCVTSSIPLPNNNGYKDYCECKPGYYNKGCADGYCEFFGNPCQNEGACKSDPEVSSYYKCTCPPGYKGDICEVRMYDDPTIKDLSTNECSEDGRINVTWISGLRSANVTHKLQVYEVASNTLKKEEQKTPTQHGDQVDNFIELSPATDYAIKIKVCPTGVCTDFEDQKEIKTGPGTPPITENFAVTQREHDGECIVSWSAVTSDFTGNILDFEMTVIESFTIQPETTSIEQLKTVHAIPHDVVTYRVLPLPNRQYEFHIRAVSCAGAGPSATANGQCYANNAPPQEVPTGKTEISEPSSTRTVQITLPDESNGPISCMFLIVNVGEAESDKVENFGIENLQEAASSAQSQELTVGTEYLALAFRRNEITETNFTATLGNEELSWCDVSGAFTDESSPTFFAGINRPLNIGRSYSYYLVASTTNRGVAGFETSEVTSFQNGVAKEAGDEGKLWIIGVVLAVLVVLVILLVTCWILRKTKQGAQSENSTKINFSNQDVELYDNATAYDNVQDSKQHGEYHIYSSIPDDSIEGPYENTTKRKCDENK